MKEVNKLPLSYYRNDDVLFLSKNLLGKFLVTKIDDTLTSGMIVETEAYRGPDDRACHAWNMRRTERNETMYWDGGICYIYLCYGMHALFNVVTNTHDIPHAILIRALQPKEGVETMLRRRNKKNLDRTITGGPGALSQALGLDKSWNGTSLRSQTLWIEDRGIAIANEKIIASARIGIDYAGEDANLPWRFRIHDNPWTSPAKSKD